MHSVGYYNSLKDPLPRVSDGNYSQSKSSNQELSLIQKLGRTAGLLPSMDTSNLSYAKIGEDTLKKDLIERVENALKSPDRSRFLLPEIQSFKTPNAQKDDSRKFEEIADKLPSIDHKTSITRSSLSLDFLEFPCRLPINKKNNPKGSEHSKSLDLWDDSECYAQKPSPLSPIKTQNPSSLLMDFSENLEASPEHDPVEQNSLSLRFSPVPDKTVAKTSKSPGSPSKWELNIKYKNHDAILKRSSSSLIKKGAFGQIVTGTLHIGDQESENVAFKTNTSETGLTDLQLESRCLKELTEKNIDGSQPVVKYIYDQSVNQLTHLLVMPLYQMSLANYIESSHLAGGIEANIIRSITQKLTKGLHFIHSNGWVHLDLKPANILLNIDSNDLQDLVISDFGSAMKMTEDEGYPSINVSRLRNPGTVNYRSPEVGLYTEIPCEEYETTIDGKTDMFSLGCIFDELWTGKILLTRTDMFHAIKEYEKVIGPYPHPENQHTKTDTQETYFEKNRHIPLEAKNFNSNLLTWGPSTRMSAEEALNHQYLQSEKK